VGPLYIFKIIIRKNTVFNINRGGMKNKNYIFSIFFILVATVCVAQVPPGVPGPRGPNPLPIDGGLLFLVISAILFGIKKLKH